MVSVKAGYLPGAMKVNSYGKTVYATGKFRAGGQEIDELKRCKSNCQFQAWFTVAKDAPEVRMDKVGTIKKQIEAGTYKVDSRDIAEKILGIC